MKVDITDVIRTHFTQKGAAVPVPGAADVVIFTFIGNRDNKSDKLLKTLTGLDETAYCRKFGYPIFSFSGNVKQYKLFIMCNPYMGDIKGISMTVALKDDPTIFNRPAVMVDSDYWTDIWSAVSRHTSTFKQYKDSIKNGAVVEG